MDSVSAVVLAAGKGKRTGLPYPKVLHPLCGKPMIQWVVDAIHAASPKEIIVVVSPEYQAQFANLLDPSIRLAVQEKPLGTGHAVQTALEKSNSKNQTVLVACGDAPLLPPETFQDSLAFHQQKKSSATILSAHVPNSAGYGRIVQNKQGAVLKIVEEKDASPKEKNIHDINSGTYWFHRKALEAALPSLSRNNSQHEYYLTDCIAWLVKHRKKVSLFSVEDWQAALGINTLKELAQANQKLNERLMEAWMLSGVAFLDPAAVYLDADVQIGPRTVIYPFTFLERGAKIGADCTIGPFAQIAASTLGSETIVRNSVVINSEIANQCTVGPYAYLRPGTVLKTGAKVGSFVEITKSSIGLKSKVPHLSYVGNTEIGAGVNIGAGTITCNYDGKEKHATVIEDGAFIGSNTNLIAPVRIGKNAVTGAGSVVTRNVTPNTTVAGVPAKTLKKPEEIHGN